MKIIQFDSKVCQDLDQATRKEWLETNGLSGYASSTIAGVNTRRHHGLLVARLNSPTDRFVFLNNVDETLFIGDDAYSLSTHFYPNTTYPEGYQYIDGFSLFPFPTWIFKVEDIVLAKSVIFVHGEQTVSIRYQILAGDENWVRLELKPLTAYRQTNEPTHTKGNLLTHLAVSTGRVRYAPSLAVPPVFFYHNAAIVDQTSTLYRNVQYPEERKNGFDFEEDLFNPFRLEYTFLRGGEVFLCASLCEQDVIDPTEIAFKEENRRRNLVCATQTPNRSFHLLSYSARSFFVHCPISSVARSFFEQNKERGSLETIIAGYPSLNLQTRDALMSLHGLALTTAQHEKAREILVYLSTKIEEGLLPTCFTESDQEPAGRAIDIPLWFIHACFEYLEYSRDRETVKQILFPVMRSVVEWFVKGTRFNICLGREGLVSGGSGSLTWMNGGNGHSPRIGMSVEIQALWYNALCEMAFLSSLFGMASLRKTYTALATRAKRSFNRLFWFGGSKSSSTTASGYLCDLVQGQKKDTTLRPNQLLALGLPFPILEEDVNKWRSVLSVVERRLLTPYGLRSAAPQEADYHGLYEGSVFKCSSAYYQGSVWPWLLGPFVVATLRVKGHSKAVKKELLNFLSPLWEHISDRGMGFISEIFDGDEPHEPRGAIAQAINVAACLELYEILLGNGVIYEKVHELTLR